MGTLRQDIRYGLRMLWKNPGFTAVIVLTLALGIGTNTAVLGFLDCVIFRCLPVEDPEKLVHVGCWIQSSDGERYQAQVFNYPIYMSYRNETDVFSGLVAYSPTSMTLGIGESVNEIRGMAISGNYFSVLGVRPVLGRTFSSEEDQRFSSHFAAVISHKLWQHKFGNDPTVIGRTISVNSHPFTVIGILPAEFTGTIVGVMPDVYIPLNPWAYIKGFSPENRSITWLYLLGRLKAETSRPQAQAALRVLARQIHEIEPNNTATEVVLSDGSHGHKLGPAKKAKWPLFLFMMASTLILIIACANVANMLLARATTRRKEIAVRLAVGASRGRIIRQLFLESGLLALLGGACGLLFAIWLSQLLAAVMSSISSANVPVSIDGRMLLLSALITIATAVTCGLAPALQASRSQVTYELKDGFENIELIVGRWSLRHVLVVSQVAISVILLVLGGLCLRSLSKLHSIDPGFDPERILVLSVERKGWNDRSRDVRQAMNELREHIAAWPGVEATSLADAAPLSESGAMIGVRQIDQLRIPANEELIWDFGIVAPKYFQTLGIPLLRGRDFTDRDGPGALKVMIVNDVLARWYWPNEDPIGKRVTFVSDEVREVIGVVKAVKLRSILEESKPIMYWPLAQVPNVRPVLLMRSTGNARALIPVINRKLLGDGGLRPSVCDVRTIAQRTWALLSQQRMVIGILNAISFIGLWLVCLGIYGVMTYTVTQRTHDIAVRMALGAQARDVLGLILTKGAKLCMTGLGLGAALCLPATRLLRSILPGMRLWDRKFLFGISMCDKVTYLGVALLLAGITFLACWLPARQAAKVDPIKALRYE